MPSQVIGFPPTIHNVRRRRGNVGHHAYIGSYDRNAKVLRTGCRNTWMELVFRQVATVGTVTRKARGTLATDKFVGRTIDIRCSILQDYPRRV